MWFRKVHNVNLWILLVDSNKEVLGFFLTEQSSALENRGLLLILSADNLISITPFLA